MPFDWSDFLTQAKQLWERPDPNLTEACFRTAVSRAYYAAFAKSKEFAVQKFGFKPRKTADDHKRVREEFKAHCTPLTVDIATQLDNLRQWRNACDYDADARVDSNCCKLVIYETEKVLQTLKKS